MSPTRSASAPPLPFVAVRRPPVEAWCRPEARGWVEKALDRCGTIHQAAGQVGDTDPKLVGRAPVHIVASAEGGRWVVRHYVRGGLLGPLLGDRYPRIGTPRPFRELRASELMRARGIPTPPVLAAAVYPSRLVYRADLVTAYIERAVDLAHLLFGDGGWDSGVRVQALYRSGELTRQLARAGVHHRDLNAKNLLVANAGEEPLLHVIDLDRVSVAGGPHPLLAGKMHLRLERSLRKWERRTRRRLEEGEWEALRRGVREGVSCAEDGPSRTP